MLFLDLHIFIFTFPDLVLCHFELHFWEIIISQLTYFAVISTLTDFLLYYFKIYKFCIVYFDLNILLCCFYTYIVVIGLLIKLQILYCVISKVCIVFS